jgi:hypothetical protein
MRRRVSVLVVGASSRLTVRGGGKVTRTIVVAAFVTASTLGGAAVSDGQTPGPGFRYVVDINAGLLEPEGPMREWRGSDGRPLFSGSPWGGVTFGIAVGNHAQIDLGFDVSGPVIGADRRGTGSGLQGSAQRVESPISDGGLFRFPFGGRAVIPLLSHRLVIGLGAGGAFLFHSDANDVEIETPDGEVLKGYCAGGCVTRYGFGAYGLGRMEYLLGGSRRVGLGFVATYTQARLKKGEYLGAFTASDTRDGWFQAAGSLSVRFGG